jgi:hypothetical protein
MIAPHPIPTPHPTRPRLGAGCVVWLGRGLLAGFFVPGGHRRPDLFFKLPSVCGPRKSSQV